MSAGRIYWGQIVCVLGACLASMVAATQWTAEALGHQPQLGPPDAVMFDFRLYAPWKFFLWWYWFDAYARDIFHSGALIFLVGTDSTITRSELPKVGLRLRRWRLTPKTSRSVSRTRERPRTDAKSGPEPRAAR